MDGLSALAVAAAAFQFLDFSLKTLDICRQIRDDERSLTQRNKELEEAIRTLKGFRKDLESPIPNQVPKRIKDIAQKCTGTTDELSKVLDYVRGNVKQISTAKAAFRALRERRTIEKLENSLKERQKLLDQALLQDIWSRVDVLAIQQSKDFASLRTSQADVQSLIDHLIQLSKTSNSNIASIKKDISTLDLDSRFDRVERNAQKRFQDANQNTQRQLEKVDHNNQNRFDEVEGRQRREKFLSSLFDPSFGERRSNITGAAPDTLQWMFDIEEEEKSKWSDFGAWLSSANSIYWICGKAGSGKSTLMAHLVDHGRTEDGLEIWSQGRKLHILSFFFWRPGTQLQKSTIGLLRCLLFQLCQAEPAATRSVLEELAIEVDRIPTWTESRLVAAISTAISRSSNVCFCLFIDGLDEYKGDYDHLSDLVFNLQHFDSVKCCVSSRPEIQLSRRFADCDRLQLQDLNYDDIFQFVDQRLQAVEVSHSAKRKLVHEVAERAEGVFLWASLVTQSLLRGALAGDDERVLWKRVRSAPRALNDLFQEMIDNVDELHKESLAFYLQCMQFYEGLPRSCATLRSTCVLTAGRMDGDIRSYSSFAQQCQRTETQIVSQSAGLLEVHGLKFSTFRPEFSKRAWLSARQKVIISEGEKQDATLAHTSSKESDVLKTSFRRRECQASEAFPTIMRHEESKMEWIHRSAYDFVFDTGIPALFDNRQPDYNEVCRLVWKGALKYFAVAPSCTTYARDHEFTWTKSRARHLVRATSSIFRSFPDSEAATTVALDELYELMSQLDPQEFVDQTIHYHSPNLKFSGASHFWLICAGESRWVYNFLRRDVWLRDPAGDTFLALFLAECILSLEADSLEPGLSIVMTLLETLCASCTSQRNSLCLPNGNRAFFVRMGGVEFGEHIINLSLSISCHGTNAGRHEEVIRRLSVADVWWNWRMFVTASRLQENMQCSADLVEHIDGLIQYYLEPADVYFGTALLPYDKPGGLVLQFTPRLWWIWLRRAIKVDGFDDPQLATDIEEYSQDVRITFSTSIGRLPLKHDRPPGYYVEADRFVTFEPRPKTVAKVLASYPQTPISEELGIPGDSLYGLKYRCDDEDLDEIGKLLLEDIWENKQGLTATEQLLALAYVKSDLKHLN